MLWFDNQAEEAANFYVSVFKNSKVKQITHYAGEEFPEKKGQVMTVSFELDGQEFTALNGGPDFKFTEAVSFVINCDTQEEIDYYWEKLTAGGGKEVECGWVADKYGLFWQSNTGKVFRRMGEGSGRAATGDARGVADEEARSRKAREGICRKVTSDLFAIHVPLMQNIPGLRSCYDKVGRLIYFGRMLDKIRLHAAGQLPPDYAENLGEHQFTLDGRCCRFLGVPYSEIKKRTLAGEPDEAVLNWAHAHGASRTDEECNVWNRFIAKLGWRDERSHVLPQRIQESGLTGKPIETLIDHIEFDEGRDPVAERAWEKI